MRTLTVMCLIFLLFSLGCQENQATKRNSALTAGMAKQKIITGETTQSEIVEVFGSPNIVTKNKSGNEVWTYDRASAEKSSGDTFWTLGLFGASDNRSSTSSKTFTLMIEFDGGDVVKDFSYRASAF